MNLLIWIGAVAISALLVAFNRATWWLVAMVALAGGLALGLWSEGWWHWIALLLTVPVVVIFGLPSVRRSLISDRAFGLFRTLLPTISQTERDALEAGTVWWDAELFSGKPKWPRLFALPAPRLTAEEQAFLDGPVEELCRMLDDWRAVHELKDLPPEVWEFIRAKGFFGMIIPKAYGGLEFSALAHSAVVVKLSTRSITAAVTVMVPNSLGPAELLLHYGTEEQKNHYLPRLARGEETPCFALTGPFAGSDAASLPDTGIVTKGTFDGREVIGIRLNFDKRYITLGPVATVIGLAFQLRDPEKLLGGEVERGITVALIPSTVPGIDQGRRHLPLNVPFQNGPLRGSDVFIPIDFVIGGREQVGNGWRMLMESLAAGRSISLPALSTGGGKLACGATGAYARVRRQFGLPIARFEGVQEALARIGGLTYMMDSVRSLTAGAVDAGEKPSVLSAIAKYHLTEAMRTVIQDAMDVQGGSGICLGPRNYLGNVYQAVPIGITVEGANILTRSLIIFGQGALRCHPFLLQEVHAAENPNRAEGARRFDAALFGHMQHNISNAVRSLAFGLFGARIAASPRPGRVRPLYQRTVALSAGFALAADAALLLLGGALKRRERLSARLGDALAELYLASAVLKRFEDDGQPELDWPLVSWAVARCHHRAQEALLDTFANFPNRWIGLLLKRWIWPWGQRPYAAPSDREDHLVAELVQEPSAARSRLTQGMFWPAPESDEPMARLRRAFHETVRTEPLEGRLRKALGEAARGLELDEIVMLGLERALIQENEAAALREAERLRRDVVQVDDFPHDFGRQ